MKNIIFTAISGAFVFISKLEKDDSVTSGMKWQRLTLGLGAKGPHTLLQHGTSHRGVFIFLGNLVKITIFINDDMTPSSGIPAEPGLDKCTKDEMNQHE